MASLVAYEDSDSEAEPQPAPTGGSDAVGRMTEAGEGVRPRGQDPAAGVLDETPAGAQPMKPAPCGAPDGRDLRLPSARLGRSDAGSCPSRRLQWPRMEPEPVLSPHEPARPSLGAGYPPPGLGPPVAACFKPVRLSREMEPSLCAQTKSEPPGKHVSSSQRKRCEDCIVPYTPKRLRRLPALSMETGKRQEAEAQGPSAGRVRAPAPLSVPPRASAFIQPYLDSPYKETVISKRVLFHLRGHRGPINSIQWCPVLSKSHMLLSTSMDKTFKVWNAVDSGSCLQTYHLHSEAVRAARWSPCGRRILSGGFDSTLRLTDLETGTQLLSGQSDFRVTALKFHPQDHSVFLCGGFSSEVRAWDVRVGKVVKSYKATIQQTLDILFLQGGSEFLSSTDASSRDSADRTIIAWDFRSSAKISNQIFHERYTCPSLALHPREPVFLAQTNGNYLALFSAVWPYRMSRRRRYEGHKVEGYSVGCECSPDGDLLVTGSADGRALLYTFRTASRARTLHSHTQACVGTAFHPVLPSVLATSSWEGDMKIWH
ncbi:PREDICTED: WD repeat-containing protein 25 [Condylura cristata]|uniref:WD repeat-containing protein 25 n=1 Tax=Condylura cristata TaxID=143302 RepID=UPI0003346981|nr:PREDICTED: WD repeat-containing protein 25 [Condylura cristata]XP_012579776.1 PREDICTED: WD repeat-containing protein 25 [Condylura cristata]